MLGSCWTVPHLHTVPPNPTVISGLRLATCYFSPYTSLSSYTLSSPHKTLIGHSRLSHLSIHITAFDNWVTAGTHTHWTACFLNTPVFFIYPVHTCLPYLVIRLKILMVGWSRLFSTFHRVYPVLGRQQFLNMYLLYWIITDVHNTKLRHCKLIKCLWVSKWNWNYGQQSYSFKSGLHSISLDVVFQVFWIQYSIFKMIL